LGALHALFAENKYSFDKKAKGDCASKGRGVLSNPIRLLRPRRAAAVGAGVCRKSLSALLEPDLSRSRRKESRGFPTKSCKSHHSERIFVGWPPNIRFTPIFA
jgi:hypothetical protein